MPDGVATFGARRAPRSGASVSIDDAQHLGAADVDADGDGAPSVPQQGADAAEHVEVGVVDADLDPARLGERLVDGLLDDVVDVVHLGCRNGTSGRRWPDGCRSGSATPPG